MKENHPHREINVLICSRLLKMSHWQVQKNSLKCKVKVKIQHNCLIIECRDYTLFSGLDILCNHLFIF